MKMRYILLAAALVYVSLYLLVSPPTDAFAQNEGSVRVTSAAETVDGRQVGDVVVNGQTVLRMRVSAGAQSTPDRARVVAERLQEMLNSGVKASEIHAGVLGGENVVMARGQTIVTADRAHARMNGVSTQELANVWAKNLSNAVAGNPLGYTTPSTSGAANVESPTAQKVVPIISVGKGLRLGGAVVTGAKYRLDEVKAVAQVDGQFGNAVRVRLLVPVSTENVVSNIRRVPETSVIGLADIGL